jgi:YD repeat-containing protein
VYTFDTTRNLETKRVEASGTAQARTITTQWHPSYRLPTAIAAPKKITTFAYDANGNLLTKSEQMTTDATGASGFNATITGSPRNWTYTYNAVGQVLTATDPLGNTTTYAYDAQGNLSTVTNALNQVTALSNYDAHGRVGRVVDPNGLTTDMAYFSRGWLQSKTVGGETDGSRVSYTYDGAHRLTDVADSLGNSIHYVLDLRGNRTSEQVRDSNGTLARQVSRVYDSLNRLQTVTGGAQ